MRPTTSRLCSVAARFAAVGMVAAAVFGVGGSIARAQDDVVVTPALEVSAAGMQLEVALRIPEGYYLYASQLTVEVEPPHSLEPKDIPSPQRKHDPFLEETVEVYAHDVILRYGVTGPADTPLSLGVGFQACSASLCYIPTDRLFTLTANGTPTQAAPTRPPQGSQGGGKAASGVPAAAAWRDTFHLGGRAAGYLNAAAFLEFLDGAERGAGTAEPTAFDDFTRRGVWLSVLLIIVWGLALNLTPCVLPMIPVNIAIIGAGTQASSRARGFALGGAYGAGIAVVYGVLGVVAALTGARFGALNAMPGFNLTVAVVFIVLALSMFDILTIDFSRLQSRIGVGGTGKGGGKLVTAFLLGGVAALLAGACVAPVVIWVLLLAADLVARGHRAGVLLPFLLGIGMGLPWPFAGAGLSIVPRPGRWMNRVKFAFGIIILAVALWYGRIGVSQVISRLPSQREAVAAAQAERAANEGWLTDLDAGLAQARANNRPIFVDFWASWCKSCLHMEKTTFQDERVRERLAGFVKVKLQAEDLGDAATAELLDAFNVLGLPTYVVLLPGATTGP